MNNITFSDFPTPVSLVPPRNKTAGTIFILPEYAKIIFYVLQCFLVVFGLSGNVLVILTVLYNSHMKKSISNLFIANLAVADIFVLAISHTFILGLEIHEFSWPFGVFVCRTLFPLSDAFYGVSIWSIVVISFHRYRGIVHAMQSRVSTTKARVLLTATWIFSVTLISIPLWIFMDLTQHGTIEVCALKWPNRASSVVYLVSVDVFFYVFPLVLIVYFYLRIRISLKKSTGFHRQMTKSSAGRPLRDDIAKRIRNNAKALRVLTPVVIVFFVTMLPITVFRLLLMFADMANFPYTRLVFFACMVIVLANSSANPVIYSIVSPQFRRSFIQFLGMKRLPRNLSQNQQMWSNNVGEYFSTTTNRKLTQESESL